MSARSEHVARMKSQLDEWKAEMDKLEAKSEKTRENVNARYQAQLVALREKRHVGEKMLEALQTAGEDSWEKVVGETENFWNAIKDSMHEFRSHYK